MGATPYYLQQRCELRSRHIRNFGKPRTLNRSTHTRDRTPTGTHRLSPPRSQRSSLHPKYLPGIRWQWGRWSSRIFLAECTSVPTAPSSSIQTVGVYLRASTRSTPFSAGNPNPQLHFTSAMQETQTFLPTFEEDALTDFQDSFDEWFCLRGVGRVRTIPPGAGCSRWRRLCRGPSAVAILGPF